MVVKRDVDDDVSYEMFDAMFKYNLGKWLGDAFPSGDYYLSRLCISLLSNKFFFDNFLRNVKDVESFSADDADSLLSAPRLFLKYFYDSPEYRLRLLFRDRKVRKVSSSKLKSFFDSYDKSWLFDVRLFKLFVLLVKGTSLEKLGINRQDVWYADELTSVTSDAEKDDDEDEL